MVISTLWAIATLSLACMEPKILYPRGGSSTRRLPMRHAFHEVASQTVPGNLSKRKLAMFAQPS